MKQTGNIKRRTYDRMQKKGLSHKLRVIKAVTGLLAGLKEHPVLN